MDIGGKCDPFIKFGYGSVFIQNRPKTSTYDPVYNEEIQLPIFLPNISSHLNILLLDYDNVGANEEMGTQQFDLKDVIDGKFKEPFWVNFYGAPKDPKEKYRDQMNRNSELATWFNGRLLLSIEIEPREKPQYTITQITDQNIFSRAAIPKMKYEVYCQVQYAMNLPLNDTKYQMKIRWGDKDAVSEKIKSKGRLCEFYETIKIEHENAARGLLSGELPDLFVYIHDGDKEYSYYRVQIDSIVDPTVKATDCFFTVDRAKTTKREDLSGVVRMRLLIVDQASKPPNFQQYGWDQKKLEKPKNQQPWRVMLNLYQGKDFASADADGLSDPWISVYYMGDEKKSDIIKKTVNPIWNQRIEFDIKFEDVEEASPFLATIWDWDSDSKSEFLGTSKIRLTKEDLNLSTLPKPTWIGIK